MSNFYDNDSWLSTPASRGFTVCAWVENGWVKWIGGYANWVKGRPAEANQYRFVKDCDELARATMLEF